MELEDEEGEAAEEKRGENEGEDAEPIVELSEGDGFFRRILRPFGNRKERVDFPSQNHDFIY